MSFNKWEQQPGGLYLAATPFNKAIPEHREAASSIMRASVETIAKVHGAEFSNRAFHNNLQALYGGDIKLELYLAKWEVCERNPPICLGAAVGWDTVGIDAQGKVRRAFYTEDVCLLNGQLRKLIYAMPAGRKLPKGMLERLERISLRNSAERGVFIKYGEVSPGNIRMMSAMKKNGGLFGKIEESAVLELQKLPNILDSASSIDMDAIDLRRDGVIDKNNFIIPGRYGDCGQPPIIGPGFNSVF